MIKRNKRFIREEQNEKCLPFNIHTRI